MMPASHLKGEPETAGDLVGVNSYVWQGDWKEQLNAMSCGS